MASFTLQSGATLEITPASLQDAAALRNAYIKAGGDDLLAVLQGEGAEDKRLALRLALRVMGDPVVEENIFKCGQKALYNKVKVTPGLLDDPQMGEQARKDWSEIVVHMIEVNVRPFFG